MPLDTISGLSPMADGYIGLMRSAQGCSTTKWRHAGNKRGHVKRPLLLLLSSQENDEH